jgi:hypothetical protein
MLRTAVALVAAALLLLGCGSSARTAHASKPGARYYEQRRAERQLRGALHPDEHLPPPVCMRFPPEGPRIVAVVLGQKNFSRVKAVFRSLRLKAVFHVSSVGAYEAHLVKIERRLIAAKPSSYSDLKIFLEGFGFTKPLGPHEEISFNPLCPQVRIGIHAKEGEVEPTPDELGWTEAMVRRYGSDYVSIFRGVFGTLA